VGVLGAIGLAGLFYTVVTLVSSVEDALNRIWRVRHGRDWASKFRDYLSVVTVGPVLMFSALALIASAQQHAIVQSVLAFAPWLMWVLTELLPYSMLCGGFTLLFRFMPNTAVTWRAAFVGGLAGGIAWKLAGSAFASFVASSARYAAIYSSFAIIVLFFIWIYVSWLIVLIAGEIAYLWQNPTDVLSRLRDVSIAAQEKNGLAILVAVARQHLAGKPPLTTESLTLATELPATTVDHIVDQMIDHAVLLESGRPSGIALARPPESIAVAELLGILRGEIGAEPFRETPDTIERAFARRKAAVTSALEGMTLRSLAQPPADATPAATNPPPGGDSSVPQG
jgi:membrane protein